MKKSNGAEKMTTLDLRVVTDHHKFQFMRQDIPRKKKRFSQT